VSLFVLVFMSIAGHLDLLLSNHLTCSSSRVAARLFPF
jgi:hypothetical protein